MTTVEIARQLLRKAATWVGLGLIVGCYALIWLEPIQATSLYWTAIINGGLGLCLAIPGSLVLGCAIASVLDGESL